MIGVIINPGAGPLREPARREDVVRNAQLFLEDLQPDAERRSSIGYEIGNVEDGGRWEVVFFTRDGHECVVEMPGVKAETLRARTGRPGPRLYVNGDSWLWEFAVPNARRALGIQS
jgi:hypothetical protein